MIHTTISYGKTVKIFPTEHVNLRYNLWQLRLYVQLLTTSLTVLTASEFIFPGNIHWQWIYLPRSAPGDDVTSSGCLQCIPHDLTDMSDNTTVGRYSHMLVDIRGFELRFVQTIFIKSYFMNSVSDVSAAGTHILRIHTSKVYESTSI